MKKLVLVGLMVVIIVVIYLLVFVNREVTGDALDLTDRKEILIPLTIHIIKDSNNVLSSDRDDRNVNDLINEVNRIWDQADISVYMKDFYVEEYSTNEIINSVNNLLILDKNFEEGSINVFFIKQIGANGRAYISIKSLSVADTTSVNDYRAFSHEIGHILGLSHVPSANMLMARGRNGEHLTKEEIEIARNSYSG